MKNAHLRFGRLQFRRATRDTTLDVQVWLDRVIAEHSDSSAPSHAHLISIFGGDQDAAAIAAAIVDNSVFQISGLELSHLSVRLGDDSQIFRGSLTVPGRRRALRHIVAISAALASTRPGADLKARRTVLCSDEPAFVLHRIAARFGLPVLPESSDWFWHQLEAHEAVRRLIGIGCRPLLVLGTQKRFLAWIGHGLKRGQIHIPDGGAGPCMEPVLMVYRRRRKQRRPPGDVRRHPDGCPTVLAASPQMSRHCQSTRSCAITTAKLLVGMDPTQLP
jgi:hypothetical protein